MSWRQDRDKLLAAIERAEGGPDALVRAVRCSLPATKDLAEARDITLNTLNHALWDWAMHDPAAFIAFLGSRWAPVGARNDPTNLNTHWVSNVRSIFDKELS